MCLKNAEIGLVSFTGSSPIMAFMGTFEAQQRRNLTLHTSSLHWYVWWSDRLGNLRSNVNKTFRRLVGGFQACQCARKFERDPRDVFPRESGGRSCTRDVTQPQNLRTSKTRKKGRHTHCVLSIKNDILLYYTNYKQKTLPIFPFFGDVHYDHWTRRRRGERSASVCT